MWIFITFKLWTQWITKQKRDINLRISFKEFRIYLKLINRILISISFYYSYYLIVNESLKIEIKIEIKNN